VEIKALKTFITVASLKNFSAAAKELHTVQPNVSRQISELEKALETKLFSRNTREVNLTEAGQVLLPEAIEIVANNTRVKNLVIATNNKQQALRIGYLASACSTFFPQLVKQFSKLNPNIRFSIQEMTSKEQFNALAENKIDISFSRPQPSLEKDKFSCSEIYTDSLVAVIPDGHHLANNKQLHFKQLEKENFILFKPEESVDLHYHIVSNCQKNGFSPNITSHHGNIRSLMTVVSAGLGISIVPSCVQYLHIDGCCFITMPELTLPLQLNIYHSRKTSPQHVSDFVDFCNKKNITLGQHID